MKKRGKKGKKRKKILKSKIGIPQPFKDIKFDRSLIIVLFAILIMVFSFVLYSHYNFTQIPEVYEELIEEESIGHECTADLDCSQPRCPGIKNICEKGFCKIKHIAPTKEVCYDLQVCGKTPC